jgi:glucose-6-phosphate isomerase
MSELRELAAWTALERHYSEIGERHLRDLFAEDPDRGDRLTAEAAGLFLDYSKNRVTDETLGLLVDLVEQSDLAGRREAMFRGEHINVTEDRPVLHVALRMPRDAQLVVDGVDVVSQVHDVLDRMGTFSEEVRSGKWLGYTGERIRSVVNIGIGGSDLGPAMAYQALRDYSDPNLECRFVSNIDPTDVWEATHDLDPARTLFVVASKTFGTLETLTNARVARRWLLDGLQVDGGTDAAAGDAVSRHFVAVSTNTERVRDFGIDPANMFGFWDWVGGRYSVDSAIGLSLMIAIGRERFDEFLAGFHAVDEHFRHATFEANLPVLHGLLDVWYGDFFGAQTHAVLPYSQYLHRFPAYLQQLTMESNGKSVRLDGSPVDVDTGAIYWGEPGTNGQHAFYQLLHQGTRLVPADFLGFVLPNHEITDVDADPDASSGADMHDLFMANLFAQTAVLAFGRTAEEVAADGTPPELVPHKVMPGNRPSSTILAPKLTPSTLGQLIALYEHSVFTQGVIWGIDSFDQWGVELGKVMANRLTPVLTGSADGAAAELDASTVALVEHYRRLRGRQA